MAFKGVFDPHPLQPTTYGLLSVSRLAERTDNPKNIDTEEHWVRGYSHIFETNPTIRLVQDNGSTAHVINDATGDRRYIEVKPFFIEVEDFASTFDRLHDGRDQKMVRQLEAGTQKAVEHEFYHGFAARANGNTNQYLTKASTATIINPGILQQMQEGLGFLEYQIAQSPIGEQGVIHMTRDMAALLGSQWVLERADESGIPHLETTNGTPIAVGSGYDGSGPKALIATTTVSGAGLCTISTTTFHGLSQDDMVTIEDEVSRFNGTWKVTSVPTTTTFTFAITGTAQNETAGQGIAYFAADQDNKWMWATGIVDVNLGKIEVTTTEPGQGYDVAGNRNDLKLKAIRPAAVHHEPSVHCGIKVQVHQV